MPAQTLFYTVLCAVIHPVPDVFCHCMTRRLLPLCALSSVLNHCEVYHIAAVVYQCYSDVTGPDSVTMEAYKPVLAKMGKNIQVGCFQLQLKHQLIMVV